MPDIQKYKSVALNNESYKKLSEISEINNRAKGRELAGLIEQGYKDTVLPRKLADANHLSNESSDFYFKEEAVIADFYRLKNKYSSDKDASGFMTQLFIKEGIQILYGMAGGNTKKVITFLMAIEPKLKDIDDNKGFEIVQ